MPIEEVTMHVAKCDECEWESNPHLTPEDAQGALDWHKANDPKLGTEDPHDSAK